MIRPTCTWRGATGVAAAVVLFCTSALSGVGAEGPQGPPQQPPVYRSGVELIAIDASVVDKSGRPVRSLGPEQFSVEIDGRPRRVVTAELVDHALATTPEEARSAAPAPSSYSSNDAPAARVPPGRVIFIVIDQGSFPPTRARGAAEAARRFVARLQPSDRVGLLAFPPPGPNVAASRSRAGVIDGLRLVVGSADAAPTGAVLTSLSDAVDIDAGDPLALQRVVQRECPALRGAAIEACVANVRGEARDTALRAETLASRSLGGLRDVVTRLGRMPERKTLVFISAGLPMTDRLGGRLDYVRSEISVIARAAAGANANIYVLHVDSSFLDAFSASARSISDNVGRDSFLAGSALEDIAAGSGGTLLRVVAGVDSAFDRVLLETSASYVLGVEPASNDRDGKSHTIKVSVKGGGAQVRSRAQFTLAADRLPGAAPESADEKLAAALRAPRIATALPVGAATRTIGRMPSGAARVLVAANVGRDLAAPLDAYVGYVVTDAAGDVAASAGGKQSLVVAESNAARSASYVSAVALKPGSYNLRLAVVDGSGRTGSVDHPFVVEFAERGGVEMGDLLLVHPGKAPGEVSPVADGRVRGRAVDAHLELHVAGRTTRAAAVSFGVAERKDGELLVQTRAAVSKPDADGRCRVAGRLDLALLPPGDYVAVAIVSAADTAVIGRREHPLRIEAPLAHAGASGATTLPRVRFFLGNSKLAKPFAAADVLGPQTLGYFAGRLEAADPAPGSPGVARALSALRDGNFDAMLSSLSDAAPGGLSAAFLKGVGLFAQRKLEPAAAQFREAIRIADDFLPAAFYLGACYAAGGRDGEAVGAWQTALVSESEARIVYDVLADALLRLEDAGQAAEILTEARGRWPDDLDFAPRLAAAQAMLDRRDEALATLDGYLARQPSDAEAAALAIRLIYEARAAGRAIRSQDADRELAAKYAALYRAAGGTNQALVERWLAFIAKVQPG